MTRPLANSIALVTGASRGIGAAVAKRLAKEGAHVLLVARTIGGLEEVDDAIQKAGGKATLIPLDVTDYAKIDELGGVIATRFGKLDIFVGNAAMLGGLSPLSHYVPDNWEKTLATNLTANWRFLRSMDALLRASAHGRALFVTSGITRFPTAYWGAYAASKAALEMMVKTYAAENENSSLKVNLVDPGIVATSMRKEAMPGENPSSLAKPDEITDIFVTLTSPACTQSGQVFHVTE